MILTTDQKDAVTELVNIAFSRTAAALSDLTGNRVELTVPEVAQTVVALGLDLRGIPTRQSLQEGIAYTARRELAGRS